jgi:hypothetical protein
MYSTAVGLILHGQKNLRDQGVRRISRRSGFPWVFGKVRSLFGKSDD